MRNLHNIAASGDYPASVKLIALYFFFDDYVANGGPHKRPSSASIRWEKSTGRYWYWNSNTNRWDENIKLMHQSQNFSRQHKIEEFSPSMVEVI
jgi:hypothetical protein